MRESVRNRARRRRESSHTQGPDFSAGQVVDLSVPLASLASPVYPGSPLPVRSTFMTIEQTGFQSNIWTFEEHTGTHVDAPAHILPSGPSIDKVSLSRYVGRGIALDFSDHPPKGAIEKTRRSQRTRG